MCTFDQLAADSHTYHSVFLFILDPPFCILVATSMRLGWNKTGEFNFGQKSLIDTLYRKLNSLDYKYEPVDGLVYPL